MKMHEDTPTPVLRQVRGSEKIADALREVSFPISKTDLIARVGETTIPHGDTIVPLADLVRGIPEKGFRNESQATREVNSRWMRITRALAAVDALEEHSQK